MHSIFDEDFASDDPSPKFALVLCQRTKEADKATPLGEGYSTKAGVEAAMKRGEAIRHVLIKIACRIWIRKYCGMSSQN